MCRMRAFLVSYTNADTVYVFDTRSGQILKIRKQVVAGGQVQHDVHIGRGWPFVRASRSREHRSQLLLTLITQETLEQFSIHEAQNTNSQAFLDSNTHTHTH